jgi:hypothetical protein
MATDQSSLAKAVTISIEDFTDHDVNWSKDGLIDSNRLDRTFEEPAPQPDTEISYGDPSMETLTEDLILTRMKRSQQWCYHFFRRPKTIWAKSFRLISMTFILLSTVLICIESLPDLAGESGLPTIQQNL